MSENSNRGFGSMNEHQRQDISSKGGKNSGGNNHQSSSNSKKGLASADQATRERVAREGGKASHGGGRK